MDRTIWSWGRDVARSRGRHRKNWELDFVRGMHQGAALEKLSRHLRAVTGTPVRLMSIWLDKHAWASWVGPDGKSVGRRELADVAVVVRQPYRNTMKEWMWLLQAKRTMYLLEPYHGTSSDHELDLLHRMPVFSLLEGGSRSGKVLAKDIDLQKDFGIGSVAPKVDPWLSEGRVPWTFLDFDNDWKDAGSAAANGYSPASARWLGSEAAPASSWADVWSKAELKASPLLASYTACLLGIVSGMAVGWSNPSSAAALNSTFAPGAPVDRNAYPEWHRLYEALMVRSRGTTSGHARAQGNPSGSVLQFSQLMAEQSLDSYRPFFGARSGGVFWSGRFGGLYEGWEGEWTIAGMASEGALRALERFGGLAEAGWTNLEDGSLEAEGVDPPEYLEPEWDEGHDGGMQVLFVDLLRDIG